MIKNIGLFSLATLFTISLSTQDGFCPPKLDATADGSIPQFTSVVVGGLRKPGQDFKPHYVITDDPKAFVINRDAGSQPDLNFDIHGRNATALIQELESQGVKDVDLLHFEHTCYSISTGRASFGSNCSQEVFKALVDTLKPGGKILFQSFYIPMTWSERATKQMYPVLAKKEYVYPPLVITEAGRPLLEEATRLDLEIKEERAAYIAKYAAGDPFASNEAAREYYATDDYRTKHARLKLLHTSTDYPKPEGKWYIKDDNPVTPELLEAPDGRWEMSENSFLRNLGRKDSHMSATVEAINQEFRGLVSIGKVSIINPEGPTVPPFYEIECTKR